MSSSPSALPQYPPKSTLRGTRAESKTPSSPPIRRVASASTGLTESLRSSQSTRLPDSKKLLEKTFIYNNTEITFDTYLDKIFTALGLDDSMKASIKDEFNALNSSDIIIVHEMFDDSKNKEQFDKLFEADIDLQNITLRLKPYNLGDKWLKLLSNLAKLQGYIILNKAQSDNCSELVGAIIAAVDEKISITNQILSSNLKSSSRPIPADAVDNKYLKYKNKYLNLKNLNF